MGKFRVIYTARHSGELQILKDILLENNIFSCIQGEHVQELFGYGRLFTGSNHITGPVELLVEEKDFAEASRIMQDLKSEDIEYDWDSIDWDDED